MARGGTFIHVINGQLMAVLVDDDPQSSNNVAGMIGIEIHGAPSKVSVRNLWLKNLLNIPSTFDSMRCHSAALLFTKQAPRVFWSSLMA
jgi:hypothetical protein